MLNYNYDFYNPVKLFNFRYLTATFNLNSPTTGTQISAFMNI